MTIRIEFTNSSYEDFNPEEVVLVNGAERIDEIAVRNPDKYVINKDAIKMVYVLNAQKEES